MKESLHALSGAYVLDALEDGESEAFEAHLPGCLDCQHEVVSLRQASALMADDAALTPPSTLRDSVLAGIKTIRPLAPPTVSGTGSAFGPAEDRSRDESQDEKKTATGKVLPLRRPGSRVTRLVAAAAAVAAIGAGVVYQPWQDRSPAPAALSAADQVLAASDAKHVSIDFKDGSSATVVRSRSQGRAVLLTRGMAVPPVGKAYEVWWQQGSGTMIPAGMMKGPGDSKMLLKGDPGTATGVGITVEPEGGSDTPSGAPIALLPLGKAEA